MNCSCRTTCTGLGIVASIIIGIITAILVYTATVTVTAAFSWVLLGVAVVSLGVTLLAVRGGVGDCACRVINALLTGILGTILTSIILLAITFGGTSVIGAIISGAALLFFTLIITSTACLIKCISDCSEE